MKTCFRISLLLVLSLGLYGAATAQSMGKLTLSIRFDNVEDGYDHQTQTKVWIDDELVAETSVKPQTSPQKLNIKVPLSGKHHLHIMNYALYEGNWEEHTIENNYSVDCMYEKEDVKFKKKGTLELTFDLDSETKVRWK